MKQEWSSTGIVIPDFSLTMVKWALTLKSKSTGLQHPQKSLTPTPLPSPSEGIKEQLIAGKVYVEFTNGEVYAGADRVSVFYNGGDGQAFLDVTDTDVHVVLEHGGKTSTLSVIPIREISFIQLVYKSVPEEPDVCIRTAEFVISTKCSPHRLFRFKLKQADLRSVVVEKICQVSEKKFPVMHIEAKAIDHVFQSRVYDYSSSEETLESSESEETAPS